MTRLGTDARPRTVRFESDDSGVSRARRLNKFVRESIGYLEHVPRTLYRDLVIEDASVIPAVATPEGEPKSVTVARVIEGTVSAAVGVDWEPSNSGVKVNAVYGVAAPARLTLRIEV